MPVECDISTGTKSSSTYVPVACRLTTARLNSRHTHPTLYTPNFPELAHSTHPLLLCRVLALKLKPATSRWSGALRAATPAYAFPAHPRVIGLESHTPGCVHTAVFLTPHARLKMRTRLPPSQSTKPHTACGRVHADAAHLVHGLAHGHAQPFLGENTHPTTRSPCDQAPDPTHLPACSWPWWRHTRHPPARPPCPILPLPFVNHPRWHATN